MTDLLKIIAKKNTILYIFLETDLQFEDVCTIICYNFLINLNK